MTRCLSSSSPMDWRDWQRREDYYPEGVMLWLDIDTRIRQQTGGKRSLDDFARSFFGIHDGSRVTVTYTFADICAALAQIAPYDWATWLRQRLDSHDDRSLLDGLTRGGYRLVYTDTPTETFRQAEADDGTTDLRDSIGLTVTPDWRRAHGGVAGPRVRGRDHRGHAPRVRERQALRSGRPESGRQGGCHHPRSTWRARPAVARTRVRIDYHGSLRYPRLARIAGTPDLLGPLLAPLRR